MHHSSLFRISILIMPLALVLMGLTVLLNRKPLIFNYKWFLAILIIALIPPMFIAPLRAWENPVSYFPAIMFAVVIAYMIYILRGYMVVGADADDFQRIFTECLKERNYEYEQTFSSIKIKEPPLEMSIAFQSWAGSGQIRLRSKENAETFHKIISTLKSKAIKTNLIMPSFYLIIGTLLLAMQLFALWR